MPVERPVVLNAEITSKRIAPSGNSVSCSSRSVGPTTAATLTSTTVIAWRCTARESRLPKMFTCSSPRNSASITKKSTKKVVTRMPPPTLAGPVPMNMRRRWRTSSRRSSPAISTD
jgi:hypothetical protein